MLYVFVFKKARRQFQLCRISCLPSGCVGTEMYSDSQKSCTVLVPFDQHQRNKLKARYFSVPLKAKYLVKLKVCDCVY